MNNTKPRKLTLEEVDASPWEFTPSQYQFVHGVHEPWIAEISPWQHASLGKRAQKEYDDKRSGEWAASAAIKGEWRMKVITAWDEGKISESDHHLSDEAKSVIFRERRAREEAAEKERKAKADTARIIRDIKEVKAGDIIDTVLYGKGLVVLKVNRKSLLVGSKHGDRGIKVYVNDDGPIGARWPEVATQ